MKKYILSIILGLMSLPAFTQNSTIMETKPIYKNVDVKDVLAYKGNPYGLVYNNAIMKNEAGKVNIHPIEYDLNGLKIRANVYTPAGYDPARKYPALVVAHPNGGTNASNI